MTLADWGTVEVYVATPAANLFALLFFLFGSWRGRWAGWAVMISKVGLAALCDAALLVRWLGPDYPLRAQVLLVAFAIITVGTYLYLFAFLRERYLNRHREEHE